MKPHPKLFPEILIIEKRAALCKALGVTIFGKGALPTFSHKIIKNELISGIETNRFKFVVLGYDTVLDLRPEIVNGDILYLIKKYQVPYGVIYPGSITNDPRYESLAFWSFVITPEQNDSQELLFKALFDEFVLPPKGDLKFVV